MGLDKHGYEHLCAFNGTTTKCLIIKQPYLISEYSKIQFDDEKHNLEDELKRKFNLSVNKVKNLKTEVLLIAKKQNIIMNLVPEKKSMIKLLKDGL